MSEYPKEREADVVLADGAVAHVRPIRPEDADAIVALHSRFSDRTRYLRYFSPYPRIPQKDLQRFVNVDHHDREALVVQYGDQLIAVGRYDRIGADDAEVAFVVEDAYQGRGVGSVLLEHLAAAAEAEGINHFTAEVLPENGPMQRVFADAGYQLERSYRDGVMHFSLDLTAAGRAVEVARQREQLAEARSIARVLHPRSVAVVGASTRRGTIGDALLRNLIAAGFAGPIYPVHKRGATVRGLRAYRKVSAIGESAPSAKAPSPGRDASRESAPSVDLAVIATPAADVPSVVLDCAAAGVGTLVIVSAGFAETGEDGAALQREVVRLAHRHGMRVVGPNCFGVANTDPEVRLNATLAPQLPRRGRVGFFCQSGAFGIALLATATERGLGLSSFVSAGNRADVSGNDLLQYWRTDPRTDAVLLYLETFGNPRKFARLARQLARRKPVVTVTARGSAGGRAEAAALFEQHGVIRVDTVGELFDVGLLLAYQPLPAGNRVGVVGNSTALELLAADACRASGLRVPRRYPVDVGPEAGTESFGRALAEAVAADDVDAIVAVFVPPFAMPSSPYADELVRQTASGDKPVVATFIAPGETRTEAQRRLRRIGEDGVIERGTVPAYPSVEEAVRALGRVAGYAQWRREPAGTVPVLAGVRPERAREAIQERLGGGREAVLVDADAAPLLACYGVEVTTSRPASSVPQAVEAAERLGYPVALKLDTPSLRGRIDLGAVRLDLAGATDVARAYAEVEARFGTGVKVLVQPMRPPGVACRIQVAQDPAFGSIVGFGFGGAVAELLGGEVWRAAPLTDVDAAALVRNAPGAPLLFGYREAGSADVPALQDLLLRVGLFVDEQPQVRSLELNPVLVATSGLSVLHATVHLGSDVVRPDTGPRRLR
jgi:acyl-CoA synthetase (NDP forming)/RimJ/RimL family protein N-acetyltransferase